MSIHTQVRWLSTHSGITQHLGMQAHHIFKSESSLVHTLYQISVSVCSPVGPAVYLLLRKYLPFLQARTEEPAVL